MLLNGGQGMLKQIFVTTATARRAAAGVPAFVLMACAGWLTGCVTSSNDAGAGPPDFQTGPAAITGNNSAPGAFASANTADLRPGTAGSAPAGSGAFVTTSPPTPGPPRAVRPSTRNYGYTVGP